MVVPSNCDFLYRPPFRDPYRGRELMSIAYDQFSEVNKRALGERDFFTDPELEEATRTDYELALGCGGWDDALVEKATESATPISLLSIPQLRVYDDVLKDIMVALRGSDRVTRYGDHKPRLVTDRLRSFFEAAKPPRWVMVLDISLARTGKLYGSCIRVAAEAAPGRGARFLAVKHLGAVSTDQLLTGSTEAWDPVALPYTRVFKGM